MWKVKLIAFTLLFIMSCQKSEFINMSLTPLKRGTVLDPSQIYFLNEYYIIENLSVRLVEMDMKAGYKLMLASSINQISDTEYLIKIKKTRFSNGEEITLADVRNSLTRAKESKNSHIAFKEIVKSITIQDEEIRLVLNKKVNDFLYFLTLADLSVLHSSQVGKKELLVEDWEKVSSGPYRYVIEEDDVFLEKNDFYDLSSKDYPQKIRLLSSRGQDSFQDFKDRVVDIGEFNLNSYEKHLEELSKAKGLDVIGNNGDMINYFALNADHPKFKNEYNRQWIQKKILLGFNLDPVYSNITRKAFQFFTPYVKGFLKEDKIIEEVKSWKHIDTDTVPEDLKNGITIVTYQRAFEVTLRGAFNNLEKILGFPVRIESNIPSTEYQKVLAERKFEAFLGITSMDQVIVGEAINLKYFSSSPTFKDVNNRVRKLMDQYHHASSDKVVPVVNEIAMQMIRDAECIPLFYVASPFFYNKNKVDISGLDEMTYFNLWKIREI